ncbi:class I SAM-dependent methyltransferase [Gemmata sp. G18]|uniref:Class I SAM-dependent methyltransferase n=1 Tax=Gemmata palustris TaxID=2822762 RepID=A0ABS5BKI2_9BACT|nr:class I SAM-dependent methyltransferase [Gemmata palustris]MBP3954180.1 class I SAM-dependent methyltransferase [Gemmata palustris]
MSTLPHFGLYVVTCPGREAVLDRTLASIRASDWPGAPAVLRQPADWPIGWDSTSRMYRTVLQRAWEDGCWWAVVLEDDVLVNRYLWANLTRWHPITTGQLHWGSLFIPDTIQDPWARACPELGYRLARPALTTGPHAQWQKARLWGSQAYVFSRGGLGVMLDQWDRHEGGQDARVVGIAGGAGWPLWFADPCLAEHIPVVSAFGTPPAYAPDFVPDFRFAREPAGTYRHAEGVPGWLSCAEGRALWELARDKRVLELGRFHGRSTVALAQSARAVVSVDVLDPAHAAGWLERFGVSGNVTLLQSKFAEIDPRLGPFDLIFVDGEHDEANVRADVELALSLLAPGGCLAFHDYPDPSWPDVRRVVDAIAAERGLVRVRQADYLGAFQLSAPAHPQEALTPEPEPIIATSVGTPPTTGATPRTVWVYWEGPVPGYIELCCETVRVHNRNARVEVLDRAGFEALFRHDRDLPIDALILPHKADFIRAYLLAHYGGIYLDADCVLLGNLDFVFDLVDTTEFVGYRDPLGYMSASFMASAPNGAVIRDHYQRVCATLRSNREREWLDLSSVPLDHALAAHLDRAHVLPTERIMPLSWQASERLAERHSDAVHALSFRSDAAMYMLSNNTIKSRPATRVLAHVPADDLLTDAYFLSFLFRRALGRDPLNPQTGHAPFDHNEPQTHSDEGALDYLATRFGVRTMIDVGCGSPETVYRAKQKGIRATGVNGDPRIARDSRVIIEHDYTRKPLFAGEFDLGWSVGFVEHVEERFVPNVMATFRGCRAVFLAPTVSGLAPNDRTVEYWAEQFGAAGFVLDAEATEGVRRHSTTESAGARPAARVFRRSESER